MIKLFDRVKVNIPTTGTGDIEFGAAASTAFLTPTEAGVLDGDEVRYFINDGLDFEEGVGLIKDTVATMERTVTKSKVGGVVGTSPMNLSGTAVLGLTASAADILTPDDNLASVEDADTALDNLGGTSVGKAVFTAVDQAAAQAAIGAKVLAGHLYGMEMAWVSGTTIGFSAGECADSDASYYIKATSAIAEKYIDVAWGEGDSEGMLDTGTISNGTYHIFAIGKSTDPAAYDYLASTSPTAPTMPATWDLKRRIGSVIRKSATLLRFTQDGDFFFHYDPVDDAQAVAYTTADLHVALTVPTGIRVRPLINIHNVNVYGSNTSWVNGDGMLTQTTNIGSIVGGGASASGSIMKFFFTHLRTDLSGRLVRKASNVSNGPTYSIGTFGWVDTRGRLAA